MRHSRWSRLGIGWDRLRGRILIVVVGGVRVASGGVLRLKDRLMAACRSARVRIGLELTLIATMLLCCLFLYVPRLYLSQRARAEELAGVAASLADDAEDRRERDFYRHEAAWYRARGREILWRSLCCAIHPGYGPNGRDEQTDPELTRLDLAMRERLDTHGFGWSRYYALAECQAARARDLMAYDSEMLREGAWDRASHEHLDLIERIESLICKARYYRRALAHPWEPFLEHPPTW